MEINRDVLENQLKELINGGFAQIVPLLNEFHYDKSGIVMDGLHFSAFSLLEHMNKRQKLLLEFMQNPELKKDLWPEAEWSKKYKPDNEEEWKDSIKKFENDLSTINKIVINYNQDFFTIRKSGKSIFWAAVTILQHNSYHIGQLKTIGRQLGVW